MMANQKRLNSYNVQPSSFKVTIIHCRRCKVFHKKLDKVLVNKDDEISCLKNHNQSLITYLVKEFYNFKAFVEQHLLDVSQNIVDIKYAQYLKFNQINDIYIMQYKATIRDEHWSHYKNIQKNGFMASQACIRGKLHYHYSKTLIKMVDLKKGINSYITHFNETMEDGGK